MCVFTFLNSHSAFAEWLFSVFSSSNSNLNFSILGNLHLVQITRVVTGKKSITLNGMLLFSRGLNRRGLIRRFVWPSVRQSIMIESEMFENARFGIVNVTTDYLYNISSFSHFMLDPTGSLVACTRLYNQLFRSVGWSVTFFFRSRAVLGFVSTRLRLPCIRPCFL